MKHLRNKILNKKMNDSADSTTIEFLFAILILVFFTIQIIDIGMYFSYRQTIVNAAQSGSRLVSVYGGSQATSISKQYGTTTTCDYSGICDTSTDVVAATVADQINSTIQPSPLSSTNGKYQPVKITEITCTPTSTTRLGQRASCEVKWTYNSLVKFGASSKWAFSWVPSSNDVTRTSPAEVQNVGN